MVFGKELVDFYFGFSIVSNDVVSSVIVVVIIYRGWNNEKIYWYVYVFLLISFFLDNEKVDKFRYVLS